MSGEQGSHKVETAEDKRELEASFGQRYERIQTGIRGLGMNRRERRRRRFKRLDRG